MSPDKTVSIDMDHEVTLSVRVKIGKKYGADEIGLSQEWTAPLFVIKDVPIKYAVENLQRRVLEKYMTDLRERALQEIREEEINEEDI